MKYFNTFIFLLFSIFSFAQQQTSFQIQFDSDQATLTTSALEVLAEVEKLCGTSAEYEIALIGHTDSDGSDDYNRALSEKRCASAKTWLAKHGIISNISKVQGLGESAPLVENSNEANKGINRRVEIQLFYDPIENVNELFAALAKKQMQSYNVHSDRGEYIRCNDGTIVQVPDHAFQFADGRICEGSYKLIVEEAIRPSAMLVNRLNTAHDGNVLSTGGMIRINAVAEGETLELIEGKSIDVSVPTTEPNVEMGLYKGSRNEDMTMNWETIDRPINITDGPPIETNAEGFSMNNFAGLLSVEVDLPENPGKFKQLALPALIKKPVPATARMKKPYKPGLPEKVAVQKPSNVFARMKFDQKAAQEKADLRHSERLEHYEKRMVDYAEAMKQYEANGKIVAKEQAAIDHQFLIDQELNYQHRREVINNYVDKCIAYDAASLLQQKIDNFRTIKQGEELLELIFGPQDGRIKLPALNFNLSLKGLELLVKGEKLKYGESPEVGDYVFKVLDAQKSLEYDSNFRNEISTLRKKYAVHRNANVERLKAKNASLFKGINEKIEYYNFKITEPRPYWCNIDTPSPPGTGILTFDRAAFSEIYTFLPAQKILHYFPIGSKTNSLYPLNSTVRYFSFRYSDLGIEMAHGNTKTTKRSRMKLKFSPATLGMIEAAIKGLDAAVQ